MSDELELARAKLKLLQIQKAKAQQQTEAPMADQTEADDSAPSMASSALQGFGQGASFGFLPWLQAKAQQLGEGVGQVGSGEFERGLSNVGSSLAGLNPVTALPMAFIPETQDFNVARQQFATDDKKKKAANPLAYGGSELVGAIAMPMPGSGAAKGAGMLAKMGKMAKTGAEMGAISGLGSATSEGMDLPETAMNVAKGAGWGGLTGAGIGGAVQAVDKTGSLVNKGGQALLGKAKDLAQYFGLGALGVERATAKQIRGELGAEEMANVISDAYKKNVIRSGETKQQTARRFQEMLNEEGKAVEDTANTIDEVLAANGKTTVVSPRTIKSNMKRLTSDSAVEPMSADFAAPYSSAVMAERSKFSDEMASRLAKTRDAAGKEAGLPELLGDSNKLSDELEKMTEIAMREAESGVKMTPSKLKYINYLKSELEKNSQKIEEINTSLPSEPPLSFMELLARKRGLSESKGEAMRKFAKGMEPKGKAQGLSDVYDVYRSSLENAASEASPELGLRFRDANKLFSRDIAFKKASENAMAQDAGNIFAGPTMVGSAVAGGGVGGVPGAVLGFFGSKALKEKGASTFGRMAYEAPKTIPRALERVNSAVDAIRSPAPQAAGAFGKYLGLSDEQPDTIQQSDLETAKDDFVKRGRTGGR